MGSVRIIAAERALDHEVVVPGSKSLTNRALVAGCLADGTSEIKDILLADDTRVMIEALRRLGFRIVVDDATHRATITGAGGNIPAESAELDCGNSGTTIRFLTALCSLGCGRYVLDGIRRMRQRPIGPLVEALRGLGGRYDFLLEEGYPPLAVLADGLTGGTVHFDSPASSQFVSALLLAAPMTLSDVYVEVIGVPSEPYVDMTLAVLDAFGVQVIDTPPNPPLIRGGLGGSENAETKRSVADAVSSERRWIVPAPQRYRAADYVVEPDASSAGYFWAAAAVAGGRVTVRGLTSTSVQGDVGFVDVLAGMGCTVLKGETSLTVERSNDTMLHGVDVDMRSIPDAAPTLAVTALFAEGPTRIRGVANLRIKESDRLAALAYELRRLGAEIQLHDDGLTVHPPRRVTAQALNTYDDHRLAMSFALVGLAVEGIVINDPECVSKTFPSFFDEWNRLCGTV